MAGNLKDASSKKYVLCKIPANWTALPVHAGPQSSSACHSIAVYTKERGSTNLVYEGFICPPGPEQMPISALQPPPKKVRFKEYNVSLWERVGAEAAAPATITSEDQINTMTESVSSSKAGQRVVKAEPGSVLAGCADPADDSKWQIEVEAVINSDTNTDYPEFPLDTLDGRESLLPPGTDEFRFEPWGDTLDVDFLNDELGFSVQQFSLSTPGQCIPPDMNLDLE